MIDVARGAAASDVQRIADVASHADDRAHEVIFTPGVSGVQKRVVPLGNDTATTLARFLVVPGTAAGTVQVMPARFIAGTAPYTIAAALSSLAAVQSPAFANNPGGTRTDQVYASITITPTTGIRKRKDPTSAIVGSAPATIYETPVLSIGIAQGTSGGAAGTVPADSATVYNFPLAAVTLPGAYVNTTPIGQTMIAQNYERGWIPPQRIGSMQPMTVFGSSQTYKPSSTNLANNSRWGALLTYFGGWSYELGMSATILDTSIDWTKRFIWGWAAYVGPEPVDAIAANRHVANSTSTGLPWDIIPPTYFVNTGSSQSFWINTPGSSQSWTLGVNASGQIVITNVSGAPPVSSRDQYVIFLFCTDRFVF